MWHQKAPAIAKGEGQHDGHAHHIGLQGCRKGVPENRDKQTKQAQYTKGFLCKNCSEKKSSHDIREESILKSQRVPWVPKLPGGLNLTQSHIRQDRQMGLDSLTHTANTAP